MSTNSHFITVTVEAGGLDDLLTADDNTTFSESFDVTVASINDLQQVMSRLMAMQHNPWCCQSIITLQDAKALALLYINGCETIFSLGG